MIMMRQARNFRRIQNTFQKNSPLDVEKKEVQRKVTSYFNVVQ